MIKILFAASKYDYANSSLGLSSEYYFYYDTLRHMRNLDVKLFDWVLLTNRYGRDKMNDFLYERVKKEKPNLVLFSIYREEFDKDVIKKITDQGKTTTFNLFTNDIWQFDVYSKYWAHCFTWIATDERLAVKKYYDISCKNVAILHWGFNPRIHKKMNLPYRYDVSFVGQAYSNRKGIIRGIKKSGIPIEVFGRGFKAGKVSLTSMIKIFNQSKINLNISEHSKKLEFLRFFPSFLQPSWTGTESFQLKARIFEVVGSGGFLLTTYGEPLKEYFRLGKEVETYSSFDELVEKARYYLKNDREREKIARAGYKRAIREYSYQKRFTDIFKTMGLL